MRPLGHIETREERAAISVDTRLLEAWERFNAIPHLSGSSAFFYAEEILRPLRPSLQQLDDLLLRAYGGENEYLGPFVSAGYQLAPETTIRYSHHTPDLNQLGMRLIRKELIIDGALGDYVGIEMSGDLTINGTVGKMPGCNMVGSLVINGTTGSHPGLDLVGRLIVKGHEQCGYFEHIGNANLLIPSELRAEFMADIANPDHLSSTKLRNQLYYKYKYPLLDQHKRYA
jgi:hypothetical protein